MKKPVFVLVTLSLVALLFSFTLLPKEKTGVGTKAPKNAELIFDGSRKMLDDKWTYWEGPRFSSELPIKWKIEKDPLDKKKTVVSSNDPTAKGGKYGTADMVTKKKSYNSRTEYVFLDEKRRQLALIRKRIAKFGIDPNELGVFTRPRYKENYDKRIAGSQALS